MYKERINSEKTNILHIFKIKNERMGAIRHLLLSLANRYHLYQEEKILILFGYTDYKTAKEEINKAFKYQITYIKVKFL